MYGLDDSECIADISAIFFRKGATLFEQGDASESVNEIDAFKATRQQVNPRINGDVSRRGGRT
jgi:hypothetical protein